MRKNRQSFTSTSPVNNAFGMKELQATDNFSSIKSAVKESTMQVSNYDTSTIYCRSKASNTSHQDITHMGGDKVEQFSLQCLFI